jgi:hypothetical protein
MGRGSAASSIRGRLIPKDVVVIGLAMEKNVHPMLASSFSSWRRVTVFASGDQSLATESFSNRHSGASEVPGPISKGPRSASAWVLRDS